MPPAGTPLGVALTRLARAEPDAPALSHGVSCLSRRDLEVRANQLAWTLRDRGLRVGDRVAIVLPDGVDFVVALLATWKAGGTPAPVSHRLPAADLRAILGLAEPKLIIAVDGPGVVTPGAGTGQPSSPPPGTIPTPWKILTSGGSSGRPRLISATAPGVAERVALYGLSWRLSEGGTALITAPLTHVGPFVSLSAALLYGKHVVLTPRFDAAEALELAERYRVDWMFAVPAMMHRIWRLPTGRRAAADLSSLRVLLHVGTPIARWLKQAWIDWLGPDRVWELYTGTECQAATRISGTEWLSHPGSVGRALTGDIQVRDDLGRVLGPRRVGRIWMRPDADPTYTYIGATATRDGRWETLGDMGYTDADGYLYLSGRDVDRITVGGSVVYPTEVEGALEEHPAVLSAAVIGLPDEDLGSVPHAIVHTDGTIDEAALLAHLRGRLAADKLPRTFEFVAEPLRDDSGRLRRSALRDARVPAGTGAKPR